MKKLFTFAALAMVAIVACNKEINAPEENVVPEDNIIQTEEPKGDVTIIAQAPAETKTMVDGLDVKWASGDHIAVLDEDGDIHDFGLDTGEGTATGAFSGALGGKNSGGYAIYPYSANANYDGDIYVDYPTTYTYDAVTVPMIGVEGTGENVGKYEFSHIGGAFKIQYTNVPAGATKFVFTSTTDITGTVVYDLTDAIVVSNEGKEVTVTGLPSSSTLTFIIPVPVGSYSFTVKLLDSSDAVIAGSQKTVSSAKAVAEGHLVPLKAILIPVANGTSLFSIDFGGYGSSGTDWTKISGYTVSDYASAGYDGRSGYSTNNSVTLSSTGSVILSTTSSTGVTSGHLWFRTGEDGSVETSEIDLYGAAGFTLNHTQATSGSICISEYSENGGTTWKSLGSHTGAGEASYSASVSSGVSTIKLRFRHESSNAKNTRVDDIELIAGQPEPGVLVTTEAATGISATGATLNGSLDFVNGGVIGSVTEAGFVVKEGDGEYGDPITVSLGGSTSFSKEITCSNGVTYHFKAYAKYNDGSAVYGEERDFIANSVVYATATSFAFTPNTTATWDTALPTSYDTNLTTYTLKADSTEWQFYDYNFNSGEIQFRSGSGYLITPPFASAVTKIVITGAGTVGKKAAAQIYNAADPDTKIADATVDTSEKTYTFTLTSQPTGAKYKITFTGAAGHCASMAVTY